MSQHRYNCENISRPSRGSIDSRKTGRPTFSTDKPIDLDFFAVRASKLA